MIMRFWGVWGLGGLRSVFGMGSLRCRLVGLGCRVGGLG